MTMSSVELDVLTDIDALAPLAADWDACLEDHGGDIYHSAAWLRVWWAHFGKRRKLALFCLRASGRLVGVIPFVIERLGPARLARLAGADPNYPFLGFGIDPDHEEAVWSAALDHLARARGCDLVSLAHLSDQAAPQAAMKAAPASGLTLLRDDGAREHTLMRPPGAFDAYMAGLSKTRRWEYRRDLKKMAERFEVERTVSDPAVATEALDRFIDLHQAQWRAADRQGHFDDWPGSRAFYHEATAALAPAGQALVLDHLGEGQPLSSQFILLFGDRAYWRLSARSLDPDFAEFGLGRFSLVELTRFLIERGVRQIEGGAGKYEYKTKFGFEEQPLRRLLLVRDTGPARAKARLLLAWADLLDLAYYRIWFLKLAPRLRARLKLKHRPLWSSWIRTRI